MRAYAIIAGVILLTPIQTQAQEQTQAQPQEQLISPEMPLAQMLIQERRFPLVPMLPIS